MGDGVCYRKNESSDTMNDGGWRHQSMGRILVSSTYSVWTNESKNMGKKKNVPI